MMSIQKVPFTRSLAAPLYQQVYLHLRSSILSGKLKGGMKLPSTRALAEELGVSRNTILNAYRQLLAEGYVEGVAGSGTYVALVLPEHLLSPPELQEPTVSDTGEPPLPQFSENARRQLAAPKMSRLAPSPVEIYPRPFRFGIPDLKAFPYKLWSRLVIRQARQMPASMYSYQSLAGYGPLREAIAAHVTVSRGVHCTADQILIVSGAQGGLDLAARVLLNPGDAVWMEDPGYLKARGAFLGVGANVIPIPVDDEGLIVTAGLSRAPQARLAYVTPSHQFPLGVTMSLSRRMALLDWAERANAYILEDDYDSEYHYTRRPLPALQGLDSSNRVIYIGTFSKVLFPALRLGYLILPPQLVEAFQTVRSLVDTHPPMLEQAVLADFIGEGHLARHLRRMRRRYADRRDVLLEVTRQLPLEVIIPDAGLHCVAWLPDGIDDQALLKSAAEEGVDLVPVSNFSSEPLLRKGILIGYCEYTPDQILDGVCRLGAAMNSVGRG